MPLRGCVEVLAAALKLTAPDPVPAPPAVTASHDALVAAVHVHPAGVVTVVDPEPPAAPTLPPTGEIEYEQPTPFWVTVKAWPAIVSVPVRESELLLAATVKPTLPSPVPLAPLAIEIHDAPLLAVQLQPVPAATDAVDESPVAGDVRLVGVTEYEHAAAVCVTVKLWPAIVSVPVRCDPAVFCATLYPTVPLPDPLAPPVMVIHDAPLVAVHAHPATVLTLAVADSPAAGDVSLVGVSE